MSRIVERDGWRTYDPECDLLFPWYTRPFLYQLTQWNVKDWRVFEYGAGDSTIWWRKNARNVISVDTNKGWARRSGANYVRDKGEFLSFPETLTSDGMFDCIIIDGEPIEWRDECTEHALRSIKDGGIVIIDNYRQRTVNLLQWPRTDKLLDKYQKFVFKEPAHLDWKTAYWRISLSP